MATLVQVADSPVAPNSIIALKVGATRFAIISANVVSARAASLLIYDVRNPAVPKLKETRKGKANSITTWARFDPTSRLATITADGKLRIHAYDKFVKGEGLELASFDPGTRKTFRDLSFDENGTLWAVESSKSPAAGNKLFEFTPSGNTYTKKEHDVFLEAEGLSLDRFDTRELSVKPGVKQVKGDASALMLSGKVDLKAILKAERGNQHINVDGKLSDGRWLPLSTKELEFSSNAGKFDGNSLFIDSSFKESKVTVKAVLKQNPSIWKEVTIYIKTRAETERLKTVDELMEGWKKEGKTKDKKKNKG
jgi:hypothetical protein